MKTRAALAMGEYGTTGQGSGTDTSPVVATPVAAIAARLATPADATDATDATPPDTRRACTDGCSHLPLPANLTLGDLGSATVQWSPTV